MRDMGAKDKPRGVITACLLCVGNAHCRHSEDGEAQVSANTLMALQMDSTFKREPFNLVEREEDKREGVDPLAAYIINRERAEEHFHMFRLC